MKAHLAIALLFAACGNPNPGMTGDDDDSPGVDAQVFMDAPDNLPAMIAVSGATTQTGFSGTSPVAAVVVQAFAKDDDTTVLAMATTDAQGKFSLSVPLRGAPWDGHVKATKSGFMDLYWYPSGSLASDFTSADINMISPGNFMSLDNIAQGGQDTSKGVIGMAVLDANGAGVAGASVSSDPAAGRYRYMESNGFPSSSATATSDDGVAFMFSVPVGEVTISATKAGATFRSHKIKIRANAFTSTAIAP